MDQPVHGFVLWIAIIWPLVLAFPAVHRNLPASRQLALLPVALLLVWPGGAWLEMPRLLLGIDLLLSGETRWLLGTALVIWLLAALLESRDADKAEPEHAILFFMLTLSGHLGAILANDLVGFFMFSTLMGYGFYGLIMGHPSAAGEGGRLYIIALVLADLALFEAVLLAAFTVDKLQYGAVSQAMSGSASSGLYVWMVLLGFSLRAGIWPASAWSVRLFSRLPARHLLLLVAVPLATGWLGLWRWLPLQGSPFPLTGLVLQLVGGLGLFYGLVHFIMHRRLAGLPGRLAMLPGSGLLVLIGGLLARQGAGAVSGELFYIMIAVLTLLLAGIGFIVARRYAAEDRAVQSSMFFSGSAVRLRVHLQKLNGLLMTAVKGVERIRQAFKKPGGYLLSFARRGIPVIGWTPRLIVFVALILLFAWLAAGG